MRSRPGGAQRIPRPPGARRSGPTPWVGVPPERRVLTVGDVRDRCGELGHPTAAEVPSPESRPAAVLLPVMDGGDGEAHLVFTRRPETMASHRGEVAFPGGKLDARLDATARDAALREAEEEIGLPRSRVEVVAELEALPTYAGPFLVSPFVGIVDEPVPLVPHPVEVARVFDVAVSELLADGVHHAETWDLLGGTRTMHFFSLEDETIWGATARILAGFLAHLTGVAVPA